MLFNKPLQYQSQASLRVLLDHSLQTSAESITSLSENCPGSFSARSCSINHKPASKLSWIILCNLCTTNHNRAVQKLETMNAVDFKQNTGVGSESLRISHRRRFSLTSLSLTDDTNTEEGNILGIESETFNCNYALIYTSGSGRHKRSSSLSSNSSSSSLSSPLWSPCNSASSSQAAIPFSWEDRPGVPKQKPGDARDARGQDLPLPPSSELPKGVEEEARRSVLARRGLRWANKKPEDPFVTALVACTRQGMNDAQVGRGRRHGSHEQGQGQRHVYSCMRACATVDAHIAVPRKQLMNAAAQPARSISKQHQLPPLAFIHSRSWDIELSESLLHR